MPGRCGRAGPKHVLGPAAARAAPPRTHSGAPHPTLLRSARYNLVSAVLQADSRSARKGGGFPAVLLGGSLHAQRDSNLSAVLLYL